MVIALAADARGCWRGTVLVAELRADQLDAVSALFTTAGLALGRCDTIFGIARALPVKPLP